MSHNAPRLRVLSISDQHTSRFARTGSAFTLVELLVVIGIIAALIGILLPVLSGVQSRGRDIKCQSNIRQIVQALMGYATENKGSMPYGFYWNRSNQTPFPGNWEEAGDNAGSSGDPDNDHPFISWASQIGKYMGKRLAGDNDDGNFPPVLKCPEAEQAFPHVVSYVMNFIVGVSPVYEFVAGTYPTAQIRPPQITQMLKDGTALIWDTAIQSDWENNVGFLTGADIDGQRFWDGAKSPQFRYFSHHDPFGQITGNPFGNNRAIRLNVGTNVFTNVDPPPDSHYPWQGNLRFRHNKGTACNVGFSDGHVEQFIAKLDQNDKKFVKSHNAIRRQFMIKWPSGIGPDKSVPY